jgi:uncharacterized membrane protein YbaN (DUF454 family)
MNKKRKKFDLQISENKSLRQMWFILGIIATGLGVAGYILPVMPGTTFMIVALYCFARSSERWHNWLLTNKYFGKTISDFKAGKGMSIRAKITALICIIGSISISMYFASNVYVTWFLIICGIIAVTVVLRQKTKLAKK